MNAPLLVLSVLGVVAALGLWVRERGVAAEVISAGGMFLLASLALFLPIDEPFTILTTSAKISSTFNVLGRSLVLNRSNQATITFIFTLGGFLFAGAAVLPVRRSFFPVGVLTLGIVATSMMVRPFLYAAFAMEFVALTGVVLLVRPAGEPNRGPLYLLTLTTLAMMAVLLAGWVIESEGVTEATPELALQAMVLLAIGFGVYLAVPPFHFWLSSSATESDPYVLTFVSLAVQSAGIFFLFRFLDTYAWLRQETLVFALLRYTGGITTLLGAIWALSQRSMRRVLAFASISDIGAILLAIGIATPDGFRLALGLMLSRVVGLALASLGLAMLTTSESTDDAQGLAGAIQSHPLATSGIVAGLLTLAGYPLTAGFPGRWGILLNLSQLDVAPSIAVLFAFIALLGTAVRWLFIFLTPSGQESQERLRSWEAFFALGGVALAAILGIFPQLIYPWILQAVEGMSQLFP